MSSISVHHLWWHQRLLRRRFALERWSTIRAITSRTLSNGRWTCFCRRSLSVLRRSRWIGRQRSREWSAVHPVLFRWRLLTFFVWLRWVCLAQKETTERTFLRNDRRRRCRRRRRHSSAALIKLTLESAERRKKAQRDFYLEARAGEPCSANNQMTLPSLDISRYCIPSGSSHKWIFFSSDEDVIQSNRLIYFNDDNQTRLADLRLLFLLAKIDSSNILRIDEYRAQSKAALSILFSRCAARYTSSRSGK